MRLRILGPLTLCALTFSMGAFAQASQSMSYKPAADAQFGPHPALPPCASIAVQDGDPGKGNSVILLKAKAGCVLRWHWHTPNERLIILSGSGKAEMKSMEPTLLKPGDFILLPSKGIHQFTALTEVKLFDISDAPFDMHYVNANGKEISPEQAFK